jgi:hypothetical protein
MLSAIAALYDPSTGSFLRFANSGYVTRSAVTDSWQPGSQAAGMSLDPAFIEYLNRLSTTSRALFANGSTLGFEFLVDVTAAPADMGVTLQIGGITGRKEGSSYRLPWPGAQPVDGFVLKTPGTAVAYPGLQGVYDLARLNQRSPGTNRVEISKARLPGGGTAELQHNGQPASVGLTFRELPGGLDGFWVSGCPVRAVRP